MASEGFSWKGLFINENPTTEQKTEVKIPTQSTAVDTKFPEISNTPSNTAIGSNPFVSEVFDVYQKGFESLNNEGFDFFELYKSVSAVGVTNPQSYQMAFAMGKSIRPDLTKDLLLDKSKFYISEIEKVYQKYHETGSSKNKELSNTITSQKNTLTKSISDLESQIAKLQQELESKKTELSKIDFKNHEMFSEIQQKIEANNIAKQKILESINTVVTGINQYL